MGNPIVGKDKDSIDLGNLTWLAAKVLSDLEHENFASAATSVSELQLGIHREIVERYDPKNPSQFAGVVAFFSSLFSDKREAAAVFGISVSTFYRWKSGESIPHALMRSTIRNTILHYMIEKMMDGPQFDSSITSH